MMLYYSVHYPKPEKEALLIDAMRHVGKIIKSLPGLTEAMRGRATWACNFRSDVLYCLHEQAI